VYSQMDMWFTVKEMRENGELLGLLPIILVIVKAGLGWSGDGEHKNDIAWIM